MARLTSQLVVSVLDHTRAGASSALRNIAAMKAAQGGLAGSMAATNRSVRQQSRTMRAYRTLGGGGAGMAGLGATAVAAGFLKSEYDYQSAMNRTQAVLSVSNKEFRAHEKVVVDLAKRYPTTSAEIAKGASELAMSGMSFKQVNEVLEATVQGSMASGESIKTVGMGVTDVVMGLGRELSNANFKDINNVMAAGATSYAQDYTQFMAGLQKTAPLAKVTGLEVERLVGMLGQLANAGFKAEKGGTALRTMMIRMGAPMPKARAQFKKYGLDINSDKYRGAFDGSKVSGADGARSLANMLVEQGFHVSGLQDQLESILSDPSLIQDGDKLSQVLLKTITKEVGGGLDGPTAEMLSETVGGFVIQGFKNLDVEAVLRDLGKAGAHMDLSAMADIFGVRFTAQASSLIGSMVFDEKTGTSVFDKAFENFEKRIPGAVERFAKILMKGLPGALKRLGGAFDAFTRTLASSGAIDTVSQVFTSLTEAINKLSQTSPGILKWATLAVLAVGVIAPLGFALQGLVAGYTVLSGAASLAAIAVARATTAIAVGSVSTAAGSWLAIGGAIGLAARKISEFRAIAAVIGAGGAFQFMVGGALAGAAAGFTSLAGSLLRIAKLGAMLTPVGAAFTAIAAAGTFLFNNASNIGGFFTGLAEGLGILKPVVSVLTTLGDGISYVVSAFTSLTATLGEMEQWRQSGREWGQWIGSLWGGGAKDLPPLGQGAAEPSSASQAAQDIVARKPSNDNAPAPPGTQAARGAAGRSGDVDKVAADAKVVTAQVRSQMAEIRAIVSGVDLSAEGERMMGTLAAGIRRGGASVRAATQEAAASQIRGAVRGAYSDGGR